jgi:hypothetical protein
MTFLLPNDNSALVYNDGDSFCPGVRGFSGC